jgi:RNA polymerase sigma factor (sigma-70 family)
MFSSCFAESAAAFAANRMVLGELSRPLVRSGATLSPTDAELLLQAARGQTHAFSACIDRFGPLVWTLARQILVNRTDAEDAVQEIFAELWRVANRFDPAVASARAFVATIARRRLIDRGRIRQRIDRDSKESLPADAQMADVRPLERLANDEQARTALEEFGRLRLEQQKVIRLAVYEDWTHERIAEHLAMPVGTVKTHLRRGLLKLRETLAARGSHDGRSDSGFGRTNDEEGTR